jgi:hypothetical protein
MMSHTDNNKQPNILFTWGSFFCWLVFIAGCSSNATVQVVSDFPNVLAQPKPISAAIVLDKKFRDFEAQPNKNTQLTLGTSQVKLFENAFKGLFDPVQFVTSSEAIQGEVSLIITPSIREVQVNTPSQNYLNVFEVWIKYNLDIKTAQGEQIGNWFMPAYGKTPDSFMASKTAAIEQATITALRDAGAKLILDFYRIPAVYSWVSKQTRGEDQ